MEYIIEIKNSSDFFDNFDWIKELMETDKTKNPCGFKHNVRYNGVIYESFDELLLKVYSNLQSEDERFSKTIQKSQELMNKIDKINEKRKHS